MSAHLERAVLLQHQGRHELAEKEARLALGENPDDPLAHAVLSECLAELKRFPEAVEEARQAIAAGPDLPFTHGALAAAYYRRNYYPEAEQAIRQAILLDPTNPAHFSLLAAIHAERQEWKAALDAADLGLAQDAEHVACGNLRAMALAKLGRPDEAREASRDALERNPDDGMTHATCGWGLLHDGHPARALEHFREALRLEPDLEYARFGLIEALKARYWLYRRVLGYFFWLSQLSPRARWGFAIGLLVLQRVVASVAKSNAELQPVLEPVLIAYFAFVLTSWTAAPLSNLFLRLNRFGRYALSDIQRRASFWVGVFAALALASVAVAIAAPRGYDFLGWMAALALAMVLVPIAGTCACQPGWPRRAMLVYSIGMVGVTVCAVALLALAAHYDGNDNRRAVRNFEEAMELIQVNIWAGLISSFLANWLASVRPRL